MITSACAAALAGGTELDKAVKFRISRSAWCTFSRGEQIRGYVHRENEHRGAHFRAWCTNSLARVHVYAGGNEYAVTPDSARAESGARADWQACTTHAFLLDHRTSCTVFQAIVVFAMTTVARSFTTHLTSFVVHRVRFGPDSRESGPNPGTGLT